MASEKVTFYRTNEDKTEVIEQLPKTVASQVYDSENKQFLNETLHAIDVKIGNMSTKKVFKGSITYAQLLALTDMVVDDYWYVTDQETNYCYNGTDWFDIGNNFKLGTDTVKEESLSIISKSKQLYDHANDVFHANLRVNSADGTLYEFDNINTTDFIEIEPNRTIVFGVGNLVVTGTNLNNTAFYDAEKNFVSGFGNTIQTVVSPPNARYMRKSTVGTLANLGVFYDEVGSDFTYWRRLKPTIQVNHAEQANSANEATISNVTRDIPNAIVTSEKIATNAVTEDKVSFINKSPQLFDYENTSYTQNMRLSLVDGTLYEFANMQTTDFIEIEANRTIVFDATNISPVNTGLNNTVFYDANKNFISGFAPAIQTVVSPPNAKYMRKTIVGVTMNLGIFYDAVGTDFTYWRRFSPTIAVEQAIHSATSDNATTANHALTATTANVALSVEFAKDVGTLISKQKFNVDTVSLNMRVNGSAQDGTLATMQNFNTSDFIPIDDGTHTIIIGRNYSAGAVNYNNIAYYREDKSYISGFNTGSTPVDEYGRINLTPPANAKFLRYCVQGVYQRIGIFFNEYSNNFNYYEYYSLNKSTWFGKKIVGFGDSLVAGASNATNSWLGIVAKQLGFEPVNRGIGGSTVTNDATRIAWVADGTTNKALGEYGEYVSRPAGLNDGSGATTGTTQPEGTVEIPSSMLTDERIGTIPTDADAIIILAGANGMDETSYRTMLQKIYTRCPQAMIFCCSLTFRYTDAGRTQIANNTNNNNIIRNLCQEFGSHFIDLKGMEGVNHYNRDLYLSDLVHATPAGNERRASVIASVLKSVEPLA